MTKQAKIKRVKELAAQLGMGCNGVYAKFCDMVVSA